MGTNTILLLFTLIFNHNALTLSADRYKVLHILNSASCKWCLFEISWRLIAMKCFLKYTKFCDFPIENLPYGVFSTAQKVSIVANKTFMFFFLNREWKQIFKQLEVGNTLYITAYFKSWRHNKIAVAMQWQVIRGEVKRQINLRYY